MMITPKSNHQEELAAMKDQQNPYRVLRMKQLASTSNKEGYLPVSESTIWRWIQNNEFPRGHKIGPKTTIWYEAEVKNWLSQQSEIRPNKTNTWPHIFKFRKKTIFSLLRKYGYTYPRSRGLIYTADVTLVVNYQGYFREISKVRCGERFKAEVTPL